MRNFFYIILIASFIVLQSFSQNNNPGSNKDTTNTLNAPVDTSMLMETMSVEAMSSNPELELPDVLPPSPRAQSFHIFGEIPVSTSTGVPDIAIPLYTINSGNISIPIILRYHPGLVKPPYDLCNVAFGWVLECGGRVSRTIMGNPDVETDRPTIWKSSDDLSSDLIENSRFIEDIERYKLFDTEYDVFSYSYLNNHGEFIVNKEVDNQFKAYQIEHKPVSFNIETESTTSNSPSGLDLKTITIVDDKGFQFVFGDGEYETATLRDMETPSSSSLMLKNIRSPENIELLTYSYNEVPQFWLQSDVLTGSISVSDYNMYAVSNCGSGNSGYSMSSTIPDYFENSNYDRSYRTIKTIKTIDFLEGQIVFDLSVDNEYINGFKIYDKNNNMIREIIFQKSSFPGMGYNRLDTLSIYDNNSSQSQNYSFTYNSDYQAEPFDYTVDYWGYFNGFVNHNFDGILRVNPRRTFEICSRNTDWSANCYSANLGQQGCRDANDKATTYLLEKIQYPTGGTTEFEFESHQVDHYDTYPGQLFQGAGERIKKIVNKDNGSIVNQKTYEYENGYVYNYHNDPYCYTAINYVIDMNHYIDEFCGFQAEVYTKRYRTLQSSLSSGLSNSPFYRKVTEYFGTETTNTGKMEYIYDYFNSPEFVEFMSQGSVGLIPDYSYYYNQVYKGSENAKLREKNYYKKAGLTYDKVKSEKYTYYNTYAFNEFPNLKIRKKSLYNLNQNDINPLLSNDDLIGTRFYTLGQGLLDNAILPPIYETYDYYISTGSYKIVTKEVVDIDEQSNEISNTETYLYDNGGDFYPTRIVKDLSNNNSLITEYKFAYDAEYLNLAPYNEMINRNIINVPIEEKRINLTGGSSEELLKNTKRQFKQWGSDVFKIELVSTSFENNPLETEITYDYDNVIGRIIQAQLKNNYNTSYLWDSNGTYLMAEVQNATNTEVENCLTSSELTNIKNGMYGDADMRTALNKIRTTLTDAMVTTYTYKLLVGITSQTGPDGRTTYYEYDSFGRLKLTRNHLGEINNKYYYHYANE